MEAPKPPRRRLRLWHLIVGSLLALVIMLVAIAFALRASGAAELRRTIADLTARGYPMTVEALRAGAVDGDPLVQEAYERWRASRIGKEEDFTKSANDPVMFDWIDRGEPVPQRLRELVDMHSAEYVDLRQAIRTGRLRVGVGATWISLMGGKMDARPDLGALREAAFFLRASALVGDPLAFSDLVGLADGVLPMRGSLDSMMASGLSTITNRTMVELECLGRLTGSVADDWLTRRPNLMLQHAEALTWDLGLRAFHLRAVLDELVVPVAGLTDYSRRGGFAGITARGRDWVFLASDIAAGFRIHAGLADRLRDPARPWLVPTPTSLSESGVIITQALHPILVVVPSTEAEYRSRHVAVLIRREAIRRGSLPSDNVAVFADKACGSWMEGGATTYWLAYERLSPTRFRIAVDPKRPVPAILTDMPKGPDGLDASKPSAIAHSDFGRPAGQALRLSLQHANTEIVVPDFPPKQVPSVPGLITPVPPMQEKR